VCFSQHPSLSSSPLHSTLFSSPLWHHRLLQGHAPGHPSPLQKKDQWANVDYFYFFRSSPSCRMGGQADKPKRVTVTETSGFKEEDRLWSIINIHLSCAINMVLSLCAVIFVLCLLAFIIHRIVRRYCKKKTCGKRTATRDSDATLPSTTPAFWSAKQIHLCRPLPFPRRQLGPLHRLLGAAAEPSNPAPTPTGTGTCSTTCRRLPSRQSCRQPFLASSITLFRLNEKKRTTQMSIHSKQLKQIPKLPLRLPLSTFP
jgi:hypothetical protein